MLYYDHAMHHVMHRAMTLHQVNANAKVSVKLVAEAGIGVVASGVAKANADVIQVSGHDGGTGASPISSIKHAGGPMEMGLAEAHQVLTANELRDRVVLRVDGGVRNGRDVLLSSALGADEYGFGTTAMIATGCIMARVCHTNNCPVGVASQREELRARFPGTPADLVNFFYHVAEEVRQGLADLGYASLNDLVGRGDMLRQRDVRLAKTSGLDLSFLTTYAGPTTMSSAQRIAQPPHDDGPKLDDEILADADVQAAIKNSTTVEKSYAINNVDRAAMGRVGGEIARYYGDNRFTGTVKLNLTGAGGQSFGCFMVGGMDVTLVGEANDYVGKGMAGGDLSIMPPPDAGFSPEASSIVGNTCLYGATGGRCFINGGCLWYLWLWMDACACGARAHARGGAAPASPPSYHTASSLLCLKPLPLPLLPFLPPRPRRRALCGAQLCDGHGRRGHGRPLLRVHDRRRRRRDRQRRAQRRGGHDGRAGLHPRHGRRRHEQGQRRDRVDAARHHGRGRGTAQGPHHGARGQDWLAQGQGPACRLGRVAATVLAAGAARGEEHARGQPRRGGGQGHARGGDRVKRDPTDIYDAGGSVGVWRGVT
jgi:hypothetical protein